MLHLQRRKRASRWSCSRCPKQRLRASACSHALTRSKLDEVDAYFENISKLRHEALTKVYIAVVQPRTYGRSIARSARSLAICARILPRRSAILCPPCRPLPLPIYPQIMLPHIVLVLALTVLLLLAAISLDCKFSREIVLAWADCRSCKRIMSANYWTSSTCGECKRELPLNSLAGLPLAPRAFALPCYLS